VQIFAEVDMVLAVVIKLDGHWLFAYHMVREFTSFIKYVVYR
jgi:hypothetical protein